MRKRARSASLWKAALLAVALIWIGCRILTIHRRFFDPDEFQHLHMAWLMAQGLIPYIDFYEHHTPLFHVLLMPLFSWWPQASSVLIAARWYVSVLALGSSAALWWVVRPLHGRRAAWLAVILLNLTVMYARKTVEIRPDVLFVLLWLCTFGCIIRGLQARGRRWFVAAGILLGLSLLTTPKALFLIVALGAIFLLGWFVPTDRSPRALVSDSIVLFGMIGLPILVSCGIFLAHKGGVQLFAEANLWDNLRSYKIKFWPWEYLAQTAFHENAFLWIMGSIGVAQGMRAWMPQRRRQLANAAPWVVAIVLFLSLFIMPRPQEQFYLILFPFIAWHAALICEAMWQEASRAKSLIAARVSLGFAVLLGVIVPLGWIASETAVWSYNRLRMFPYTKYTKVNFEQAQDIDWIIAHTLPAEPIFDLEGRAVMRPDANQKFWGMFAAYRLSGSIPRVLREANCRIVLKDYGWRYKRWLRPSAKDFIASHYLPVQDHPMILVSGVEVSGDALAKNTARIDLATDDRYRIYASASDSACRVSVDGQKAPVMQLTSGMHELRASGCSSGMRIVSEPRRAMP